MGSEKFAEAVLVTFKLVIETVRTFGDKFLHKIKLSTLTQKEFLSGDTSGRCYETFYGRH